MRVALLALHFAEYSASLARALAQQHQVLLILSERNVRGELGDLRALDGLPGLQVLVLPHRISIPLLLANIGRIAWALRRFKPEVIHCQEELKDYLIGALPWMPRAPFVLTVHDPRPHAGSDERRMNWSRFALYERWLRRKADHVVVHGEVLARAAAEVMPRLVGRIHVIPHGPLGELSDEPIHANWTPGHCLFFGRMEAYKGLRYFVEAIRLLRSEGRPVTGVIAGRGPALDELIAELQGDSAFVIHNGYLSAEQVRACFDAANVVVLPYTEGTQSGVAAHALGRGRPLVVTDVGSLADMVIPGANGTVVPPRDAAALAAAIDAIVGSPEVAQAMGRRAAELAATTFSWRTIAQASAAVYAAAGLVS